MTRHLVIVPVLAALVTACASKKSDSGISTIPITAVTAPAIYVVNGSGKSMSVIDFTSNAVIGTIALKNANFPHHLNLNADRTRAVVAIPEMDLAVGHENMPAGMTGAILLMEAATGRTLASRVLDAMNHNGVFSPDGTEIWTSQMTMPGSVLVLDATTLETKETIAVGDMPSEVTFAADGSAAFVADTMGNDVTLIDPATKQILATIPVGMTPVGAWPASNGKMYVDNEAGNSITTIDVATRAAGLTYNLGFTPGMARLAPNGELWVTNGTDGKIAWFSTTADTKLGELVTGAGAHAIAFSADGSRAYVSNQGAATVSVISVATHSLVTSVSVGEEPNGIAFRTP